MSLARSCLAVCTDGYVVAFECVAHHGLDVFVEYAFRCFFRSENAIEVELFFDVWMR
jgi:hypothetical protein